MLLPWNTTLCLEILQREAFNVLPGTMNTRWGVGLVQNSGLSQGIPVTGWAYFEDELAKEATWASKSHLCHVCFVIDPQGGLTSNPQKLMEERESNIISHHQQGKANISQIDPTIYPPGYEMKMAVQEFHKLHEPKINKLKGGSSTMPNLIFQSWLKDIKIHEDDQNLTPSKRGYSTD